MSKTSTHTNKRQKRHNANFDQHNHLQLIDIIPLTSNQRKTFNAFRAGKNLFMHGVAGTGKTFISIYLSLKELEAQRYDRIIDHRVIHK